MLTFDNPMVLFLSILLVPLVYFKIFWPKRGGAISFPFGIWEGTGFFYTNKILKLLLLCSELFLFLGLLFNIFALAGPSIPTRQKVFLNRGIDTVFVLDESPSMSAMDLHPVNRFEAAKEVIRKYVKSRENDSVGLVSFGKEAALRVPPTQDYVNFLETLDSLKLMDLGDGSSIGMGIAIASLHLKSSTAKEKIIILLTDGEANSGEILPAVAADIAAKMNIRIYSIGIGTEGEVPMEFIDPITGKLYRGTLKGALDKKLLKKLSKITGGMYFSVESPGALDNVFRLIDSLETVEKKVKINVNKKEKHNNFIIFGLIMLSLSFLIKKVLLREVI